MLQDVSVHRALAMVKTTRERLTRDILYAQEGAFITVRQSKKSTINGIPVADVEREIQGNWDKITQLTHNLRELKLALINSNAGISDPSALQRMKVAGKNYTLAELIAVSDQIYGNKKSKGIKDMLLSKIRTEYAQAIKKVEKQHDKIEADVKAYLNQIAGSDKQAMTSEETQKTIELFHANGDYVLVDPLNLNKKIEELEAEINQFKLESDAAMSEHNALTILKVDLTTVD